MRRGALGALFALLFIVPMAASADTELLTTSPDLNPGFETGTGDAATGWTAPNVFLASGASMTATPSIATDVANVHSGSRAATLTVTAVTGNAEAKWLSPPISVTPGEFIKVSDFYKSDVPTSVSIYPVGESTFTQPQSVGIAAASPSAFSPFTGTVYQVPAGVVSIEIGHTISAVGTLTTDDYSALLTSSPAFLNGLVTLSFDDGWQSQFDLAKPILDTYGIKSTFYIITGPNASNVENVTDANDDLTGNPNTDVDPNNDYMSSSTILQLQADGQDIGAHTRTHPSGGVTDPTTFASEIDGSHQDLLNAGFTPVDNFAYPEGVVTTGTNGNETAVIASKFAGARGIAEGTNNLDSDKFNLNANEVFSNTAESAFEALVNNAVSTKTWQIFFFHKVAQSDCGTDTECITKPNLDAMAKYLHDNAVQTITVSQGLAAMGGAAITPPPPPANHTVTVSPVTNGTVTPGTTSVANGGSQTFTITPATGFKIDTITINGVATTTASSITLSNVTADETLAVTFADDGTAPSVKLSTPSNPTNATEIPVTATFSKPVTGFDATDITVDPAQGTVDSFVAASSTVYTFNVAPVKDGSIAVSIGAGLASSTADSNVVNAASNVLSISSSRTAPVITLTGDAYDSVLVGHAYTDPGATISGTTTLPTVTGTVNTAVVGTSTLTYSFTDFAGNIATPVTRTVVTTDLDKITDESSSNVSNTSVTITWTTSASGTSRVVYDTVSHNPITATSSNYGYAFSTVEDSATTTNHSVTVTGLTAGTKYYFRTVSHASPEVVSSEGNFTTAGNPAPVSSGGGGCTNCGGGGGPIGLIGAAGFYYNGQTPGSGVVLGASTSTVGGTTGTGDGFKFLKNLSKGMRNGDVLELQKRLIVEGFLVIDAPTTYFGNLTFAGVKAYQNAHGIETVGNVGPKTRASLNGSGGNSSLIASLKAQLQVLMARLAALIAAGSSTSTSSTSMTTGTTTSMTTGTTTPVTTSTSTTMSTSTATSTQQ